MPLGFGNLNLLGFTEGSGQALIAARLCFYAEVWVSGPHCGQCPCWVQYLFLYIWCMKAIVVTPKSNNEFKFVADLLKKLGIGTSTLTKSEIEDLGMLKLLSNVDKTKKSTRSEIMKKLTV
jgi:hypothetical protein